MSFGGTPGAQNLLIPRAARRARALRASPIDPCRRGSPDTARSVVQSCRRIRERPCCSTAPMLKRPGACQCSACRCLVA